MHPPRTAGMGSDSVFAGVFELDDANGICGLVMSPEDLLDALTSLVDKSILIREEWGTTVCFRMLETLREYGREKAEEAAQFVDLRRRHHDWHRRLVAEAEWISAYQLEWITRLERQNSNLREALEFSLAGDDDAAIESSLTMTATLLLFWLTRGRFNEGRNWLGRALARKTPGFDGRTRQGLVCRERSRRSTGRFLCRS